MSSEPEPPRGEHELKEEAAALQQRPWALLSTVAAVAGGGDPKIPQGAHIALDLHVPPRCSRVVLSRRLAPAVDRDDAIDLPRVVAADPSGRLLLHATQRNGMGAYFLSDEQTRRATRLPPVPASLDLGARPRRSSGFGLVVVPARGGGEDCFVAKLLRPKSSPNDEATLLYYSGTTAEWNVKRLAASAAENLQAWSNNGGAIAHAAPSPTPGSSGGSTSPWACLSGTPCVPDPDVHFVALPEDREVLAGSKGDGELDGPTKHRHLAVSEGNVRYLEISSLEDKVDVRMWKLMSSDAKVTAEWTLDYQVPLVDIWEGKQRARILRKTKRLLLALVHPYTHSNIFFILGTKMFSVDTKENSVRCVELNKDISGGRVLAWALRSLIIPSEQTVSAALYSESQMPQPLVMNHVKPTTRDNFVGEPDQSSSTGRRDKGKSKAMRTNMKRAMSLKV